MKSKFLFFLIASILSCKSGGDIAPTSSESLSWSFGKALAAWSFASTTQTKFSTNSENQFTFSSNSSSFTFSNLRTNCVPIESSVVIDNLSLDFEPGTCGISEVRFIDGNGNVTEIKDLYYIVATRSFGLSTEFLYVSFIGSAPVSGKFTVNLGNSSNFLFANYYVVKRDYSGTIISEEDYYADDGTVTAQNTVGFIVSSDYLLFRSNSGRRSKIFKFNLGCCAQ
jgi:hypothetical protein